MWIDVGNKAVGVEVMQAFLRVPPEGSLHVGDQFLSVGNDFAARASSPCIWIISPNETVKVLEHLLEVMGIEMPVSSAEMLHEATEVISPPRLLPESPRCFALCGTTIHRSLLPLRTPSTCTRERGLVLRDERPQLTPWQRPPNLAMTHHRSEQGLS